MSKGLTIILGIIFYVLGAISVNVFFEELKTWFFFHPAVELIIISLGVFFLSAFFYGRLSFLLMFFAGTFIGGSFSEIPLFTILALLPLLFGLIGGTSMGQLAKLDLKGKKNFFDETDSIFAYLAIIIVTSLVVGFLFGFDSITALDGIL